MLLCEEPVGQGHAVVPCCTMDSRYRTMLVNTFDLGRIESNLLLRKNELIQASSWMMNILMLVLVAAGFGCFLYIQYHETAKEEEETKRIPFEPVPWLSATRNGRKGGRRDEAHTL